MSRLVVTHLPASPRAPWLEARRADVTASEVAALYGRHKYLTRLQLAYNKIYGERDSGGKPDVAQGGGTNPAGLSEGFEAARETVRQHWGAPA